MLTYRFLAVLFAAAAVQAMVIEPQEKRALTCTHPHFVLSNLTY